MILDIIFAAMILQIVVVVIFVTIIILVIWALISFIRKNNMEMKKHKQK